MRSYESSKWHIKLWRGRWYIYAIFLFFKTLLNVELFLDFILSNEIEEEEKKSITSNWKEIKKHVELSKMCKYS